MSTKSRAIARSATADAKALAAFSLFDATFGAGLALLRKSARRMAAHRRRRRAQAILAALDDRTLQDIGIARSEISSVILNPGEERLREFSGRRPWC